MAEKEAKAKAEKEAKAKASSEKEAKARAAEEKRLKAAAEAASPGLKACYEVAAVSRRAGLASDTGGLPRVSTWQHHCLMFLRCIAPLTDLLSCDALVSSLAKFAYTIASRSCAA